MKEFDVIVIGSGLSGLGAAALLAKRGIAIGLIEQNASPGGCCASFKRNNAVFDCGDAMFYGFGESGFNANRFLFDSLEEPISLIKHEELYAIHYAGEKIVFYRDSDRFISQLARIFPGQENDLRRFYRDMYRLYNACIEPDRTYSTCDTIDAKKALPNVLKHPFAYKKMLSYMNESAETLLKRYFSDERILSFFDKLTSTYCYAKLSEAPAIMAAVMFVNNHKGGSFYPIGGAMQVAGKLEKSFEESGGRIFYSQKAESITFDEEKGFTVTTEKNEKFSSRFVVYSASVFNLYEKLIPELVENDPELLRLKNQKQTYPCKVLYALVRKEAFDSDTLPIEMLADENGIGEDEITLYISSIDCVGLCEENYHTVTAICPSFEAWNKDDAEGYKKQKEKAAKKMIGRINKFFPRFKDNILYTDMASPLTVERFTMKPNGSAAGPVQSIGSQLLNRQHIRTKWKGLYACGESTVMGTGTCCVVLSGIAAANAVLADMGKKPFSYRKDMPSFVKVLRPRESERKTYSKKQEAVLTEAKKCELCLKPSCCETEKLNVPAIMRRIVCGNFRGAREELWRSPKETLRPCFWQKCALSCKKARTGEAPDIGKAFCVLSENNE